MTARAKNQRRLLMQALRARRRAAGMSSSTTSIESHRTWRKLPKPTRPAPQLCESCGDRPNGKGRLHLDHDHETGKFRGWLCMSCNVSIGGLGDSVRGLLRALDYLLRNE